MWFSQLWKLRAFSRRIFFLRFSWFSFAKYIKHCFLCVFQKVLISTVKKTHVFHFSPDFLQSSFTLRIWNWWNCVLISFEKKTLIFETLLFQFVEQKRAWLMVFSKGDQIVFLKNDFFTLEYQISQNVKKVSKTVFSARLVGVCKPQKKTQIASPSVILKHQNENHSGIYDLKNPRAWNLEKPKNDVFFSARLKIFFKTQRHLCYALEG